MSKYLWSKDQKSFIPVEWIDSYKEAGWDIDALIPVDDSVYDEFSGTPPLNKVRGVSKDGMPEWVDIPPLSKDQLIEIADRKKATLKSAADSEIAWRQDAVDAEIATDEEKSQLLKWKKYRIFLMRTDTSTAPDITWPDVPE